jgi:hypothetical protein
MASCPTVCAIGSLSGKKRANWGVDIFQVTIKLPHEPFEMPMTVRI